MCKSAEGQETESNMHIIQRLNPRMSHLLEICSWEAPGSSLRSRLFSYQNRMELPSCYACRIFEADVLRWKAFVWFTINIFNIFAVVSGTVATNSEIIFQHVFAVFTTHDDLNWIFLNISCWRHECTMEFQHLMYQYLLWDYWLKCIHSEPTAGGLVLTAKGLNGSLFCLTSYENPLHTKF